MKKTRPPLGQHFLVSRDALALIVRAARLDGSEVVLEIGPGRGMLTRALARRAKKIIAIEKDRTLAAALRTELAEEKILNAEIIPGDILRMLPTLPLPSEFIVVANIPYYLTSRLIRMLLERETQPARAILMVQKEVAERIIAAPPKMNLLALSVQAFSRPRMVGIVPKSSFTPQPNVDSAVIELADISRNFFNQQKIEPKQFFTLAKTAFGMKRKTLVNSLASVCGGKIAVGSLLKRTGFDAARPEELSLNDWARLTRAIH